MLGLHSPRRGAVAQGIGGARSGHAAKRRDETPDKPEFFAEQKMRPNEVVKPLASVGSLQVEAL
jgi:hypothetical protein